MRNLTLLSVYRDTEWERRMGGVGNDIGGAFKVASPIDGGWLRILATNGEGWDHVSVSRSNRCPNWPEMEHVKRLFFRDDETAMQLHVPPSEHINCHPHCLHIWRPHDVAIPQPPAWMVGPTSSAAA